MSWFWSIARVMIWMTSPSFSTSVTKWLTTIRTIYMIATSIPLDGCLTIRATNGGWVHVSVCFILITVDPLSALPLFSLRAPFGLKTMLLTCLGAGSGFVGSFTTLPTERGTTCASHSLRFVCIFRIKEQRTSAIGTWTPFHLVSHVDIMQRPEFFNFFA